MKNYLKYLAKDAFIPMLVATILGIALYIATLAGTGIAPITSNNQLLLRTVNLYFYIYFLIALIVVTIVRQTNYLKDKKSNDLYLSLPVNRTKLLLTNLIVGFIQIMIVFTIVYWLNFLVTVISFDKHWYTIYYYKNFVDPRVIGYRFNLFLPLFFILILSSLITYLIFAFFYLKANNWLDGLIMIALAVAIPIIFTELISELIYDITREALIAGKDVFLFGYSPVSGIIMFIEKYEYLITNNYYLETNSYINFVDVWLPTIIMFVVSLGFLGLMIVSEKKRKNENINQITYSLFGYKTLFPITIITLFTSLTYYDGFEISVYAVIVPAIFLGLYMIYQKTIKLHYKYYLMLIGYIVIGIGAGLLINTIIK